MNDFESIGISEYDLEDWDVELKDWADYKYLGTSDISFKDDIGAVDLKDIVFMISLRCFELDKQSSYMPYKQRELDEQKARDYERLKKAQKSSEDTVSRLRKNYHYQGRYYQVDRLGNLSTPYPSLIQEYNPNDCVENIHSCALNAIAILQLAERIEFILEVRKHIPSASVPSVEEIREGKRFEILFTFREFIFIQKSKEKRRRRFYQKK